MNHRSDREEKKTIWQEETAAAEREVDRRELSRSGVSAPRLWARRFRAQLEWTAEILAGVLLAVIAILVILIALRVGK